jgi:hypothetical protein
MAKRIEVRMTDENGHVTTWDFNKFDYVEIETIHSPGFYSNDFFAAPISPPQLNRLSFHIEYPRGYTIYAPHLAKGIDQGDIVEEAPPADNRPLPPGPPNPPNPTWNRPFG